MSQRRQAGERPRLTVRSAARILVDTERDLAGGESRRNLLKARNPTDALPSFNAAHRERCRDGKSGWGLTAKEGFS